MPVLEISVAQLRARLDVEPAPLLLDVREPWEVALCAIEGSRNLPMRQVPDALDTLEPDRETVCICHHGARSLQVALFLEQAGFKSVINLSGGIDAWAREIDPDMTTY